MNPMNPMNPINPINPMNPICYPMIVAFITTLHSVTSHVQCAIAMCIAAPAGTVTILCPILGGGQTVRTAPARPKK